MLGVRDLPADDGHRLHGLRAALGPDVFHGAVVITNLFGAIPLVGESITTWLWGGFAVDNPTLNRFFSLHYLLPFVIAGVVILHIWALHVTGQNNPTGHRAEGVAGRHAALPRRTTTVKDSFGDERLPDPLRLLRVLHAQRLGHADNYIEANPLVTPRTSFRNGTSCRSTRSCAPCRTS
jgi:quinol-cytochrome oxidoreductase complex cytochrome b subunit